MIFETAPEQVGYESAVATMEAQVAAMRDAGAPEKVWFLEHPPLYTAGTSARDEDLLDSRFPVHKTGRGGQFTYHGPGQRVAYVMLDLKKRQSVPDVRDYVWRLEEWIIQSLARFGVAGERRAGRVGIWVVDHATGQENKVAAVGVRIRHWVTYHGIAINVHPDLSHFSGIVPCGIQEHGVTSLQKLLARDVSMEDVDAALKDCFAPVFDRS